MKKGSRKGTKDTAEGAMTMNAKGREKRRVLHWKLTGGMEEIQHSNNQSMGAKKMECKEKRKRKGLELGEK